MSEDIGLEMVFMVSDDIVVREIGGEIIIVPITAGIGDMEDELYTVNEAGKEILKMYDGSRSLDQIAAVLSTKFNTPVTEIQQDVLGFTKELFKRNMLVRNN
jgi:hypothetical protein